MMRKWSSNRISDLATDNQLFEIEPILKIKSYQTSNVLDSQKVFSNYWTLVCIETPYSHHEEFWLSLGNVDYYIPGEIFFVAQYYQKEII